MTIVKYGGECPDECYLSTGTLTENTNCINIYRMQVRIRMNTPADYFLKNPLGNHHIMIHGSYEEALNEPLLSNACKRTEQEIETEAPLQISVGSVSSRRSLHLL